MMSAAVLPAVVEATPSKKARLIVNKASAKNPNNSDQQLDVMLEELDIEGPRHHLASCCCVLLLLRGIFSVTQVPLAKRTHFLFRFLSLLNRSASRLIFRYSPRASSNRITCCNDKCNVA